MNTVLNWLCCYKTDLEYVQDIIIKNGVTNIVNTNPVKDQRFNVGEYLLEFGYKDAECQLRLPNDNMPLFIFQDEDVVALRQTVINVNAL